MILKVIGGTFTITAVILALVTGWPWWAIGLASLGTTAVAFVVLLFMAALVFGDILKGGRG